MRDRNELGANEQRLRRAASCAKWRDRARRDRVAAMRNALAIVAAVAAAAAAMACSDAVVSRELGARCDSSSECDDRCLPEAEGYPGGLCTLACNTTGECPGGAACVEREGGVCLYGCASAGDCTFLGAGWICQELESRERPEIKVKACRGG